MLTQPRAVAFTKIAKTCIVEMQTQLEVAGKRGNPRFKKGEGRGYPGSGRKPGTANQISALVRAAVVGAGEAIGFPKWDNKNKDWIYGEGGLQGYIEWMALNSPKAYASLLSKLLPTQVTGEDGGPVKVKIIDESVTPQQAAQLYMETLKAPPMIDVTPIKGEGAKEEIKR